MPVMTESASKEKLKVTDRKIFERRVFAMQQEYNTWKPTHKDIQLYINPLGGFFDDLPNQGRAIDHKTMLDGYPRRCVRTAGAGMTSGLTSPARPWFRLAVENEDLMEFEGVRLWLDQIRERMMNVFSRSNIYGCLTQCYEELASFATGAIFITEDPYAVIRGRNFTMGEYWLAIGPDGRVNALARKYWMTISQLVEEFGLENCSASVQNAYKVKTNIQTEQWISIIHLVESNDERVPDQKGWANMTFRSIQWEESSRSNEILRLGGYEEFPLLAPRWQLTTTADIYGKGPGWEALGDCKMLQKMVRKKLLGLDKTIDPPVQKDSLIQGEVNTLPGGINTSSASTPNAGLRAAYQIQIDLRAIEESIDRTKADIGSTFYTDLFLMLTELDRRDITATEVAKRYEEKILMLGPVLERLEDELLDPLIDRTFAIMLRVGIIPKPPPELQGQDLKVEYISILAQAQKLVGTNAIASVAAFVKEFGEVLPEVFDKFDMDEAIEKYAEMYGIPTSIIRSKEATEAIRKAKQDSLLQQQQAQGGLMASEIAQKLSQAKIGEGSALDALIATVTGKQPVQKAKEKNQEKK